ncbi:Pectinesterase, catalytic [Sesbania bispinosa]|nr:Pectinesterase, catalytic [Sesbania bispinosa]
MNDAIATTVDGEGFLAQGIAIQNAAGAIKEQAVALRVGALTTQRSISAASQ